MKKAILKIKGIKCRIYQVNGEVRCYSYKCYRCCGLKNCDCDYNNKLIAKKNYKSAGQAVLNIYT